MVPKNEKSDTEIKYVIFGGGMSKYFLFLTGVGGLSGKGQKHPYMI